MPRWRRTRKERRLGDSCQKHSIFIFIVYGNGRPAPALPAAPGAEGSVEEFVDGHRGRRCRYRGLGRTHLQRVLTALAINVERLSLQKPADGPYRPRPPTAFQQYLDKRGLPRPLCWRQGK
ncbi:transposase [Streptomyces sp. NPDC046831]|uniref:transposase n=1 Tax=Streptomyces sp. NPDC046831 TaxID=3154805 RepID=UPI0033C30157